MPKAIESMAAAGQLRGVLMRVDGFKKVAAAPHLQPGLPNCSRMQNGMRFVPRNHCCVQGPGGQGCLLELTSAGSRKLELAGGGQRTFLEDGDAVVMRGWCQGGGYRIGFGECRGRLLPLL
jgi:hypothetical protein